MAFKTWSVFGDFFFDEENNLGIKFFLTVNSERGGGALPDERVVGGDARVVGGVGHPRLEDEQVPSVALDEIGVRGGIDDESVLEPVVHTRGRFPAGRVAPQLRLTAHLDLGGVGGRGEFAAEVCKLKTKQKEESYISFLFSACPNVFFGGGEWFEAVVLDFNGNKIWEVAIIFLSSLLPQIWSCAFATYIF